MTAAKPRLSPENAHRILNRGIFGVSLLDTSVVKT